MDKAKSIGIFGGTFNPVHESHIKIAKAAISELSLDEVWILPAGDPPHKDELHTSSAVQRLDMCSLAFSGEDNIRISDIELKKPAPSYTYETITALKESYPEYEFTFIMGEDSLRSFSIWLHPEIICLGARIAVATRSDADTRWGDFYKDDKGVIIERTDAIRSSGGESLEDLMRELSEKYGGEFVRLSCPYSDVSSSRIRKLTHDGETPDTSEYLKCALEKNVWDYICEHRLYKRGMKRDEERLSDIRHALKKELKSKRYYHTIGVMDTCAALAARWGYPIEEARYAGLLHDCAKGMSGEELLKFAKKNKLTVRPAEEKVPELLHAKVGAYLAKHKYGIDAEDVLHAISVHTTGCVPMSLLDKILYIADYIEPLRDQAPRLNEVRSLAFCDIDAALYMILYDTVHYLKNANKNMDEVTEEVYEYYKEKRSL